MEVVNCPFCHAEIAMADVEKNAGACPECSAMVTGSLLFEKVSDEDHEDADLDDDHHAAEEEAPLDDEALDLGDDEEEEGPLDDDDEGKDDR